MTNQPEWWQNYFNAEYEAFYSGVLTPQRTLQETLLLEQLLQIEPEDRVLDLCCGSGRHAEQLGQRGWNIVGIDASSYMLSQAQQRIPDGMLVRGDIRQLPFKRVFHGAYCMFTSFGYFQTDAEHLHAIQQINQVLRLGARFVLDVINRDFLVKHHHYNKTHWVDGQTVYLEENQFDWINSRAMTTNQMISPEKKISQFHDTRVFSVHELKDMLLNSGFAILDLFGDLEAAPFQIESYRQVWLTEVIR